MKKLFVAICLLAVAYVGRAQGDSPILNIVGGQVQGVASETAGVTVYRGIPYAAPPVGDLRWKAPQPVVPWQGIRVADRFGSPAIQPDHKPGEFYFKEFFWQGDPMRSEDCLYLNVWTPAPGKTNQKLPVAMWIHGGAYMAGWGTEVEMDGEAWAARDVILVTINYRLGIFGFFAHPLLSAESPNKVSGNYGIQDQIAALRWIKDNIAQFGGDPDNITVFGQSAGAGSVQQLVNSPLSKNLIKKAIIQSGGGLSVPSTGNAPSAPNLAGMEKTGKDMMDLAGATTLDKLRSMDYQQVLKAQDVYTQSTTQRVRMAPFVDNYVTRSTFSEAVISNQIADIPYMIGYTTKDNSEKAVANFCLEREKTSKQPAYAYLFSRELPGDDSGAFHSSELWYMFGTLKRSWRPFIEADYKLSKEMLDCWTNFAKYGNPNGNKSDDWRPYTKTHPEFKIFNIK